LSIISSRPGGEKRVRLSVIGEFGGMVCLRRGAKAAALFAVAALTLSACGGGDYSGGTATGGNNSGGGNNGGSFANSQAFFDARVAPALGVCRTCHLPGGVANAEGQPGRRFVLAPESATAVEQYNRLKSSWEALGRGVETNRILTKAANTDAEPHSAGALWPAGSVPYNSMRLLLGCWDNPTGCAALLGGAGGGGNPELLPLLGGARGGNTWANFCADKDDNTPLPRDPRTLIVPGVNEGKAVAFNAWWIACDNAVPRPETCGDLREQAALGGFVALGHGEIGSPTSFAGGTPNPDGLEANKYNNLWRDWGLPARPDNFDQLVAERYGSPASPGRNPYPLPGEDPNVEKDCDGDGPLPPATGGCGQLPAVFTQLREPNGRWRGEIGQKVCVFCHSGQIDTDLDWPGKGPQIAGAGSIGDFTVAGYDFGRAEGLENSTPTNAITISTNRGSGAIDFFQLAFVLFSGGDPELLMNDKILLSQAIGNIKSPPWWNLAYRPQKFHGAILPTDSSRIDLAAYYNLVAGFSGGDPMAWVDQHAGPFQTWAETLPSPTWPAGYCTNADGTPAPDDAPQCINRPLAEQGAILFHAKDLWAPQLENPVPRPEQGNGSCASCHGVYSPRYAHDPAYLDSPELMGVAAYVLPMSIVGTDPVYASAMQSLRNRDGSVSPSIMNQPIAGYCGLGEASRTPNNTPILLAPPLWGIWAAAPYFHNGSVPNVWGVLDPERERPRIWRRVSAPARADQTGQVVMGFDTHFERAYEPDKLGWKYEALNCGAPGTQPLLACDPTNENSPSPVQQLLGLLYTQIGITWNLPRPEGMTMTQQDIENRKIYNTNLYSQGNGGHAFTRVLTDAERRALIEYLKTL
jgi:endo-cleaving rubber dioxygenase